MPKKIRVLIDECLDRRLADEIPDKCASTVPQMGWTGLKNGELLNKAQVEFDVFVTSDQNLSFQQNLPKYDIAVAVLCARSSRLDDLQTLIPILLKTMQDLPVGKATPIKHKD